MSHKPRPCEKQLLPNSQKDGSLDPLMSPLKLQTSTKALIEMYDYGFG